MNKIILGIVGENSAGKGTVCQYLKNKYQAGYHRFSIILQDILKRLGIEESRENLQKVSTILRETFGQDLLAKTIAKEVKDGSCQFVAVDGVRRLADIKYLKEIKGFYLVYITAKPEIRYQRTLKRDEKTDDSKKTFKQFLAEENQESEQEIKKVAETAEFTINNNGTLEDLYKQIDGIISKISNS